jgi:hypothetical protein
MEQAAVAQAIFRAFNDGETMYVWKRTKEYPDGQHKLAWFVRSLSEGNPGAAELLCTVTSGGSISWV